MDELFRFKEDEPNDMVAPEVDPFRASMAEALNCAVCNEVFTDPHLLSCGHCFCGPCLFNWFRTKKSCPKCRLAVVKVPTKAFCIQYAADVLCEHSPHISRSGNTETVRREQWRAYFAVENEAGYIVDTEDFVRRCITCAWEIGTGNRCHNCGAQYNSDPEYRDDTADEDSDDGPIDYEREFGVSVEQQQHIYQDIQNRRNSSNDGLYQIEASDDDVVSDDDSENMNYRDEEDLDEFVVSDDHDESSVHGTSSNYSSDEEQYTFQQPVNLDESSDERQILGRNNGLYVMIDEDDDVETIESDDDVGISGTAENPMIQDLAASSDDGSTGEGPSTRMNNLSISSNKRNLLDLATSSEDDTAGEGPSTARSNKLDKRKGKGKVIGLSSEESTSSDNSDSDDDKQDEIANSKDDIKTKEVEPKSKKATTKSKKKKASKKRKRKEKGKEKSKKKKSD